MDRGASRFPVSLASIAYASALIGFVLAVPAARRVGLANLYLTDLLLAASFATIGLLVTRRRSDNPIGWLFLAIAVVEGITGASNHYAIVGLDAAEPLPGSVWAAWLGYWLISLAVPAGLFLLLLILFPSGRPLSRRWGLLGRAGVAYAALFALSEILTLERMELTTGLEVDNPTNVVSLEFAEWAWLPGLALLVPAVIGLVIRLRRSRGEERQQLRWFVFVVAASIGSMLTLTLTFFAIGAPEPEPTWVVVGFTLIPLGGIGVGIPAACGIAVLRYRLWDLDVVIRKAVLYVAVALLTMIVFAVVAVTVGGLVGRTPTAAVVAAALSGFSFWPVLRLARRLADLLVYGRRATPYEVLTEFSERMGEAYATDDVLPRLAQVLGSGTGAEHAHVWLRVSGELRPVASWPDDDARRSSIRIAGDGLPLIPGEDAVEIRDRGELLGALSVVMPPNDPMDPTKERLVRDLASQAGLVLRNVRLVEELRASRQRLVAAQDEERRRLERNIHDGAQQQLVALAVKARLARTLTDREPSKAAEMLVQIESETQDALEDLRDLARGIYPPLLADRGLPAALEAQARKSMVPVTVEAAVGRYPQEVEATVYFCALEALQNVAKYANASRVTVHVSHVNGHLAFTVSDDGDGFDASSMRHGTGLQGMADRLDAVNGSLEVDSAVGRGTTVAGHVPVRAT
jgi:signal transduction histidine kinase